MRPSAFGDRPVELRGPLTTTTPMHRLFTAMSAAAALVGLGVYIVFHL